MISTIISILVFFSCWIQDDVAFYVSVVSYAVLIFLFNIVVKIDIFFIDKIRSLYYVTFIIYLSIHNSLSIIYLSVRPSVSPHTFLQTSLLSFLTLFVHFPAGFCGGSDPDPSHASQQSCRNSQWTDTGPEGRGQSYPVARTHLDCWVLHLGSSQSGSTVRVRCTQHPPR